MNCSITTHFLTFCLFRIKTKLQQPGRRAKPLFKLHFGFWLQLEMCQTAFSLSSVSIKVCMSHLTALTFTCELVQTDRAIRQEVNGAPFDHMIWDGISEKRDEEQSWPELGSQVSQLGGSEIWDCGQHKAVAEIWACGFNCKCYAALYEYLPQWEKVLQLLHMPESKRRKMLFLR